MNENIVTHEQLQEDGWLLLEIPEKDRTYEMCKSAALGAIKHYDDNRNIIDFFPKHLRTRELCLEVVKRDGDALRSVPEHLKDREMCLAAVSGYGEALTCVPDNLRDEEMCRAAVLESGRAWWYVPTVLRDKALALLAVRSNPIVFMRMPDELKDETISLRVMRALNDIYDFSFEEHIPPNILKKIWMYSR